MIDDRVDPNLFSSRPKAQPIIRCVEHDQCSSDLQQMESLKNNAISRGAKLGIFVEMSKLMSAELPTDKLQQERVICDKATRATKSFSPTRRHLYVITWSGRGAGAVSCSLLLVFAFISELAARCAAVFVIISRRSGIKPR